MSEQFSTEPISQAIQKVLNLFDIEAKPSVFLSGIDENKQFDDLLELVNQRRSKKKPDPLVVYFRWRDNNLKWNEDSFRIWKAYTEKKGLLWRNGLDIADMLGLPNTPPTKPVQPYWQDRILSAIKAKKPDTLFLSALINDPKYSLSRVSHDGGKGKFAMSCLITAFRETSLWQFETDKSMNILIVDDNLYEYLRNPENKELQNKIKDIANLLKLCKKLTISCYSLTNGTEFLKCVDSMLKQSSFIASRLVIEKNKITIKDSQAKHFSYFHYLLIDLWYYQTRSIRGMGLIEKLRHRFLEKIRRNQLSFVHEERNGNDRLPEILAYSVADDSETIQLAQRLGAAGYVVKKYPESLALAIVRAGLPLGLSEATRFDWLCSNNFPALTRIPRQISKNLLNAPFSTPKADGIVSDNNDVQWLRKIPKADLHIHFGTAVPLKWCYILSFISLMHWKLYWSEKGDDKNPELASKLAKDIRDIINCAVLKDPQGKNFRRNFLECFSNKYGLPEAVFLKDAIAFLKKLSHEDLSEKQIACIINVLLAERVFEREEIVRELHNAKQRLLDLKGALEGNDNAVDELKIHNLIFSRDCRYVVQNLLSENFYNDDKLEAFEDALPFPFEINTNLDSLKFDPLSLMLSTDIVEHPYGLERYLAASDLVGSTLMQFADTILLSSMSIPEWAASCKRVVDVNANSNKKGGDLPCENVIHLELRTTPQGFLEPYGFRMKDYLIAAKLICVGLEYSIRYLLRSSNGVSVNLLFSIKRDRERESIDEIIRMAIDMRDEYRHYLDLNKHISETSAYFIPHVVGLDVAGIERGNLPEELRPYFREAFDRCLLSTIHAGETEPSKSIKDAVFLLSASRIGHGLSMKKDAELKRMVADRRICVELCPKSNQFTNGFSVFSAGHKNNSCYVYEDYRGKLFMTINSDNPTISHRATVPKNLTYPLSIDYVWLAGMIDSSKSLPLSRLEVLSLAYNSFCAMFASEQVKQYKISIADDEVLSLLAKEYLDIDLGEDNA